MAAKLLAPRKVSIDIKPYKIEKGLWAYWTWTLDPKATKEKIKEYKDSIRKYVVKEINDLDSASGIVPPHTHSCRFKVTHKKDHHLQLHATITINPPPIVHKGGGTLSPPAPNQPPPPPIAGGSA